MLAGAAPDLARLPSAAALDRLLDAARAAYGVPDHADICAAPGSELLIRLLPHAFPGPAAIVRTSYASYREAWAAAGQRFRDVDAIPASGQSQAPVFIVVNPNNPDGHVFPADALAHLSFDHDKTIFIVDEAFADSRPNCSLVPRLSSISRAILLKSFGKFFGLPGLRLGFAIGAPTTVDRLRAFVGDWPVSAAAIAVGTAARAFLAAQCAALGGVLARHGFADGGSCRRHFRLALRPDVGAVHRRLAERGIWTRRFDERPDAIRFGLPADDSGLARLDRALAEAAP